MPWNLVPKKFKAGTLKSSSGKKVKDRSQMIAIMLSEKRNSSEHPEYSKARQNGVDVSPSKKKKKALKLK